MPQFDVFQLSSGDTVLDCQSDQLWHLSTRVVVPLIPLDEITVPIGRLNPVFLFDRGSWVMMTHLIATVPNGILRKKITSLAREYLRMEAALDTLTGSY